MDLNKLLRTQWDRTTAIVSVVLGAVFLLVGWIGVSGTAYLAEQSPYIVSGGIGGVFLLGIGATLWISADLRDEWRKLDRIERALGDGTLRWVDDDTVPVGQLNGNAVAPAHAFAAAEAADDEIASVPTKRKPAAARTAHKPVAARGTAQRTARTPRVASSDA